MPRHNKLPVLFLDLCRFDANMNASSLVFRHISVSLSDRFPTTGRLSTENCKRIAEPVVPAAQEAAQEVAITVVDTTFGRMAPGTSLLKA